MKPSKIILSLSGISRELDTAKLPPVPAELPTERNGEKITYAWKVMAAPGDYTHPVDNRSFKLTEADFRQMERTHRELRDKQGYFPYFPVKHTLTPTGKENLGKVIDVIEHDGLLVGLHEIVGDEAKKIAARNESSIYFQPQWVDQFGKKWPNVIIHNAAIPDPVLTGLGGFVEVTPGAIAASRAADGEGALRVPIFALSRSTNMLKAALIALLALPADATDESILDGVKTKLNAPPVKDPALETELAKVKGELDAAKIALSRSSGQLSPEMQAMQARLDESEANRLTDKVDSFVSGGKLTPAQAAPIKSFVRGANGSINQIALSRSAGKGIVETMLEVAMIPKAPASGENTGAQDPIELARSSGAADPLADVKAQAKAFAESRNK